MVDEVDVILEGDENEVLDVGAFDVDPVLGEDVWLLGKVLTSSRVSFGPFRSVMQTLWSSRNCLEIRHVGSNLFSFRFKKTKDRDLVLKSGPWFFNRHMVVLNKYDVSINPGQVPMSQVPFWVQVHGLPFTYRTETVAKSLARGFDGFLDWDKRRDGEGLRIRVWVSLNKPLRKGQMVAVPGREPIKAIFKYEKLYDFCFRCGHIDHINRDCGLPRAAAGEPQRFGAWLRASGGRKRGAQQRNFAEGVAAENGNRQRHRARQGDVHGVVVNVNQEHVNEAGNRDVVKDNNGKAPLVDDENGDEDWFDEQQEDENGDTYEDLLGEEHEHDGGNITGLTMHERDGQKDPLLNQRKRSSGSSSSLGVRDTGISPPLKRQNSVGLGLAATAERSRPPQ
ncbi:uncharacterized protein LOC130743875 [Lotus japonicus]|uniref:uncharacterized protein LOC130743875 n=1 Tax=Lotus japonicus TaxID=34305 RepID=UPI002586D5AF|nr:uncharacterized protein LOC130743875 [Lotus japonicus]